MRFIDRFIIVILILLVQANFAAAASANKSSARASANDMNQAALVEYRSKLEQIITEKYRDRISTQVVLGAFNVSVSATIEFDDNLSNSKIAQSTQEAPSDITMGIVERFSIPDSSSAASLGYKIRIKRIAVMVGLDPKLGDNYKTQFTSWLNTSVKAEFGSLGVAQVNDFTEKPISSEKKEPEPPRLLNWAEKFGYFQNLIGLVVLALGIVVVLIIAKRMPSKDTQEQLTVALRIQEMKNSQLQLAPNEMGTSGNKLDKNKSELQLSANLLFDNYRDHQKKLAFIALSSPEKMDQALDLWFEGGEEGRRKIASLVDSVLTQFTTNHLSASNGSPAEMQWQMPEKIRNDKELPAVFRAFATLPLVDKTLVIEKTYWDILSLKTLSDKAMRPKFASISHLPAARIQKILSGQDQKVKSLTLLHLPTEKLNQVMGEMTFDEKKNTVLQAFELTHVREKEIDLLDETLRFRVQKEESVQEGTVEVQSLIPNLLMLLKPTEEIALLKEIVVKLPDKGDYLKQTYPSLLFLTEWPEEKLKILVGTAGTQEILSLIQILPEISAKALSALPGRTKRIIEGEIGKRQFDNTELDQYLEILKYRLYKIVNDGQVSLAQIFKTGGAANGRAA